MNGKQDKTDVVTLRFYIKDSAGTPGVTVQWEEDQIEVLKTFNELQLGLICAGLIKDKSIPNEVKRLLNDFGNWFHKGIVKENGLYDYQ